MHRKTRFVCVSDTHAYTPSEAGFKLPAGDVLIHAGDLTNKGSISELRRTMDWISKADFEVKIVVAGNHDITLDQSFYSESGASFHYQNLEEPQECIQVVMQSSPSIVYLRHQSALIRLTRPDGPNTIFKVFGSPHSQFKGNWAFGYKDADASALWGRIPLDTDILVTHTPPHSHCDSRMIGDPVGCKALHQAMSRIRPMLSVCGHVHEARGYERVRWQHAALSSPAGVEAPNSVIKGDLPPLGSKKQSLVDLTGRRNRRLENDGFSNFDFLGTFSSLAQSAVILEADGRSFVNPNSDAAQQALQIGHSSQNDDGSDSNYDILSRRKETCIVNAAVMAKSWPHKGGKKFNAPIVVDLELPVWMDKTGKEPK